MSDAFWIVAGVVALISLLTLKGSVRLVAKTADNGWDNALSYVVFTALLTIPLRWIAGTGSWILIGLAPVLAFTAQTIALKTIYELPPMRAWLLGMAHTLFTSVIVGSITFAAGAIAAYIWYGRIIADPLIIVRLVLKWLGIELPFPI